MEEHGGEISSEEANGGHAAGTSSIMQSDAGEHEVYLSHLDIIHHPSAIIYHPSDSIFRVPGLFKVRNEQAYTPYKFSIGPWHFGETQLLRTGQILKESFFEGLINRFTDPAAKKRELEDGIRREHDKARECYEGGDVYGDVENMDEAREKFEKILLLDGCFIIELFRASSVHFSQGMIEVIYHDLLLLENQIPWFVLELLFGMTNNYLGCKKVSLVRLAMNFFVRAISYYNPEELRTSSSLYSPNILHLVNLLWNLWGVLPRGKFGNFKVLGWGSLIPSATRLKEAGVKFKAESRNILDVRFNKGVLKMPRLLITPSTETIFRNLIIYEQCSRRGEPRVTCYAILLDCLVDTSDDVDLMSRAGILDSRLSPEETVNVLNRVRDNTFVEEFFYTRLCEDVNNHCKRRWPRWRASLIQNYFTKPWAIISVVFATIVLFFTIMQVFYK